MADRVAAAPRGRGGAAVRRVPALGHRNYRMLLAGQSVANVGSWMQRLAQDWLVLQLTGNSGVALGLVTGLQFLPMLLLGPLGGVVADRFPKPRVLQAALAVTGGCGLVLGLAVLTGVESIGLVYATALVLGVAGAVFQPTVQAFVLEVVDRSDLPSAVALSGGSFHSARLVGPALAGVGIGLAGTGPVFLVAALTVLAPILALARMDPTRLRPAGRGRGGPGMLVDGFRYAVGVPEIRVVLAVLVFVGTFAANSPVTNALMATSEFGRGAGGIALFGTTTAVGSLAGAALAATRRTVGTRYVLAAALAYCLANLASAAMPGVTSFAVALAVVGLAQLTFTTAANSAVQLAAAPELRGRVTALFMVVLTGTTPIGAPLSGWVAQELSPRVALAGGSLVALVGTVVVALVLGPRRSRP